jgi:hypothetical protein
MKSSPVRNPNGRLFGVACSVSLLFAAATGCTGNISRDPDQATGSATGAAGTSSSTTGAGSSNGTGGVQAIAPSAPAFSWYDTLTAATCGGAPTALPSSRIWRLSAVQWQNTVASALSLTAPNVTAFPEDQINPGTGFSNDSTSDKITLPLASAYFDASDTAATQAAPAALTAVPCLATAPIATTCGSMFVSTYGQKLFRRALTATEVSTYATYLNSESKLDPAQTAVASTIKAMLLSPNFLYRTEVGNSKVGQVQLTSDEIASLLSYTIADGPPDAQLQAAAAAGQLSDPAMRTTQAVRLAALPAAKGKLGDFWNQYLALGDMPTSPGIELSTYKEATDFFSKVVWDNSGSLKDLLTAPYTYVDPTDTMVPALYGTNKPDATGKLALDPTQRAGFLTSAAMLVQTAAASQAATVIHRGLLVRERVLCEYPPPPPATVVPDPAQIQQAGPDATARQNYVVFTMTHQSCNACHMNFQPLGLAFENYDGNGKFQSQYATGMAIDPTGTLDNAGDASGDYKNAVDMATKIGGSQISQYCFAQQFAEYAFGRAVDFTQEACTIRQMGDYVTGQGGKVSTLLASFAASPTLTQRIHQ